MKSWDISKGIQETLAKIILKLEKAPNIKK
jgi:hypothetical protein